MAKIFICGAGGFGCALTIPACGNGHEVFVYTPFAGEAESLRHDREHKKLLPGVPLPETLKITESVKDAHGANLVIMAVPSFAVRDACRSISQEIEKNTVIACVSKGIEDKTFLRMSEVIESELPCARAVALTGPSHAEEVGLGIPTSVVAACRSKKCALLVQELLMSAKFRIYLQRDIVGAELGGAFKNIIALAAGICDGLGLGDNTKAALMTRGLSEIAELGVVAGAKEKTFAGLSGMGDLIVTCTSPHSRNRRAGLLIGQGIPACEAIDRIGTVEGFHACLAVNHFAKKKHVEMPITTELHDILFCGKSAEEGVLNLMSRPKSSETESVWI